MCLKITKTGQEKLAELRKQLDNNPDAFIYGYSVKIQDKGYVRSPFQSSFEWKNDINKALVDGSETHREGTPENENYWDGLQAAYASGKPSDDKPLGRVTMEYGFHFLPEINDHIKELVKELQAGLDSGLFYVFGKRVNSQAKPVIIKCKVYIKHIIAFGQNATSKYPSVNGSIGFVASQAEWN